MSPALSDLPVRTVTRVIESLGLAYVRTKGSDRLVTGTTVDELAADYT